MHNNLLLDGEVLRDRTPDLKMEMEQLRIQIERLKDECQHWKNRVTTAERSLHAVRKQLDPLYGSLQVLFGHLPAAAAAAEETRAETRVKDPRMEMWKQRFPGRPAEMIELLEINGSMSVKNFMTALGCGRDAVYQCASKLGQAGVVVSSGGRYSLKR